MPDFSNSVIYKIVCKDSSIREKYIGHTTNFNNRMGKHKSNCNCVTRPEYNFPVYKFIRDHGGWDNWEMVELYKYPCVNIQEIKDEEGRAYNRFVCYFDMLNDKDPSRNKAEYNKQFREENREEINEWHRDQYNTITKFNNVRCDCGITVIEKSLKRHMGKPRHTKRMKKLEEVRTILLFTSLAAEHERDVS